VSFQWVLDLERAQALHFLPIHICSSLLLYQKTKASFVKVSLPELRSSEHVGVCCGLWKNQSVAVLLVPLGNESFLNLRISRVASHQAQLRNVRSWALDADRTISSTPRSSAGSSFAGLDAVPRVIEDFLVLDTMVLRLPSLATVLQFEPDHMLSLQNHSGDGLDVVVTRISCEGRELPQLVLIAWEAMERHLVCYDLATQSRTDSLTVGDSSAPAEESTFASPLWRLSRGTDIPYYCSLLGVVANDRPDAVPVASGNTEPRCDEVSGMVVLGEGEHFDYRVHMLSLKTRRTLSLPLPPSQHPGADGLLLKQLIGRYFYYLSEDFRLLKIDVLRCQIVQELPLQSSLCGISDGSIHYPPGCQKLFIPAEKFILDLPTMAPDEFLTIRFRQALLRWSTEHKLNVERTMDLAGAYLWLDANVMIVREHSDVSGNAWVVRLDWDAPCFLPLRWPRKWLSNTGTGPWRPRALSLERPLVVTEDGLLFELLDEPPKAS
jgi:hypothetical protein